VAEDTFLTDDFVRQLTAVGGVDIVVGLPTFNNRATVGRVLNAIQVGLAKYFPRERSVLINPDGGSTDGTPELVRTTTVEHYETLLAASPLRTFQRVSTVYPISHGSGLAWRTILAAADLLGAKACISLSPDLESITPEWVDALVRPIYKEKFDFVAPIYRRHKFDGLLIKNVLWPLIRATYGSDIREPTATEVGLSGRLASHLAAQDVWRQTDTSQEGLRLWMTTLALVGNYRVCQAFLGPKTLGRNTARHDIVATVRQAVGELLRCLEAHEAFWMNRSGSQPTPVFGFQYGVAVEPVRINRARLLQTFRTGAAELASVLKSILTPTTLQQIQQVAALDDREFRFPDDLWVKTIYEFAASYHHSVINRDHLLQALVPLYQGRVASFVLQHYRAGAEEVEQHLEALSRRFEELKAYLVEGWTAKK
jgi:hypothetical protein